MPNLGSALGGSFNDLLWRLSADGRLYIAADADQNDFVTGQTSFAATTPTFLLKVPANVIAVPIFVNLSQTGTVAGGAVDVLIELDDADRYASGGTAETAFNPNKLAGSNATSLTARTPACTLYSGATASAGYGVRVWGATIGQDVSPAEGAVPGPFWRAEMPYYLTGPAAFLVYTYAGTTGPTWAWSIGWAEIPLGGVAD